MSPDFLSGLNERQLEAVTLPHQPALILAGAGSGKTRVLTTRVAWLIQTGQASPHGLVAERHGGQLFGIERIEVKRQAWIVQSRER